MTQNKRILSGIQPTGNLHLGNYFGAINNFVLLQKEYECFFMLANMHAITVKYEPQILEDNILETTAALVASGIDPKNNTIFVQSSVSAHAELAWIFNCTARIGWLNRMTQFKEKAGSNKEKASVGLLTYPILMAADILLYRATHVPVGEDQKQHLELCRDIAIKFNNDFKANDFFVTPEPIIPENISRVMSLRDGTKKMSKSEESDLSRINLTDDADLILKKIQKGKTDSEAISESILKSNTRPEARNLINIFSALTGKKMQDVITNWNGKAFSEFKKELGLLLIEKICPIGKEIIKLKSDPVFLKQILKDGSKKAQEVANTNLMEIKKIVGLV
ncbi:tryptophanyl-tRNA synthetase [Candidatus Pelagibacter sp. IMCC9063]|uniref:tryptophan--tRNA ligase n=1 Tax=Pelagibacter sp. (strain IMCC9063) TaxID=1002672 RepID=UPI000204673B|nr:tryptophan--tRNA ligase [Candidatus Pelagibacter sp. IMCC9063]AEA80833.1 tryptophanyl-tRNA synthetase [Candidatus Pelagibacter sp. IMCC9063]